MFKASMNTIPAGCNLHLTDITLTLSRQCGVSVSLLNRIGPSSYVISRGLQDLWLPQQRVDERTFTVANGHSISQSGEVHMVINITGANDCVLSTTSFWGMGLNYSTPSNTSLLEEDTLFLFPEPLQTYNFRGESEAALLSQHFANIYLSYTKSNTAIPC